MQLLMKFKYLIFVLVTTTWNTHSMNKYLHTCITTVCGKLKILLDDTWSKYKQFICMTELQVPTKHTIFQYSTFWPTCIYVSYVFKLFWFLTTSDTQICVEGTAKCSLNCKL